MGFFSFLKEMFAKPKTLQELLEEEHTSDWYESNASQLLLKIIGKYTEEGEDAAINLMCLKYFESFSNIKYLRTQGMRIDTVILGKELCCEVRKAIRSQSELADQAFAGSQLLKERNNPFIPFIKKLDHNFYGMSAFVISRLIFLGRIDVEKDEWLYDKALFACDVNADDEQGNALFEKVQKVLVEKNLFNEEIMNEIQSSM